MPVLRPDIRNIAIIAHVDHGKTTLVDCLLRQAGAFRANERVVERVLDSNDLERERGITILAKVTSVHYGGVKINIVDTPGHADFGGEVERVLSMVDGALLLVDAFEGPMAQTKFVLRKALAKGLRIAVAINKVDRPDTRPTQVLNEVFDLFAELEAADWQLDFPVVYASSRLGTASLNPETPGEDMRPLLDLILREVPAPEGDASAPVQFQATILDYDDYVGRVAIGRVVRGELHAAQNVGLCKRDGSIVPAKLGKLWVFEGLKRQEAVSVRAGEIAAVAGLAGVNIGETVSDAENPVPLPLLAVDEPTLTMTFMVNDSPFAGREGRYVTSRHLRDRLWREAETDVALRVAETGSPDAFQVAGRGELHLGILIETMRREGYELQVSKPEPILKIIDGAVREPYERLFVSVPEIFSGAVIENLGRRRGEMVDMRPAGQGQIRLEFSIPARGLIGFRSEFLTETKGEGAMHHLYDGYEPWKGEIPGRRRGVLVAFESGDVTAYAIHSLEDRGIYFVRPMDKVYAGQIVGEHARETDLEVNVCKKKHLTNMRSSTADEAVRLTPPRDYSLEEALEYIAEDELVEVTPSAIRLRKKILDRAERSRAAKRTDCAG